MNPHRPDDSDRPDVVGFGEAMVLVAPADGETLESTRTAGLHVAGAELNACAAVTSLGLTAAFAGRVGDDPLGRRVRAAATRLGVRTDLLAVDPDRPTGVFFKDVRPDGQRRVHYYRAGSAASAMDATDADRVLAARPGYVVVSGITVALGPGPREAVRRLVGGAAAAGVRVVLDPNLRPALGPVDAQAAALAGLLARVDVLLLGTDEAGPLFGVEDPAAVFAAARAAGIAETVLKAGADGCHVLHDGAVVHLPTAATRVVDPVGAGDAFCGGYLAGRLRGGTPVQAARLGTALAARVVETAGDTDGLPTPEAAAVLLADLPPPDAPGPR